MGPLTSREKTAQRPAEVAIWQTVRLQRVETGPDRTVPVATIDIVAHRTDAIWVRYKRGPVVLLDAAEDARAPPIAPGGAALLSPFLSLFSERAVESALIRGRTV